MHVDEGEASLVRAHFQGRGFSRDDFRGAEHLVLSHLLAADCGAEASPPPPPPPCQVEPVSARQLLKKGIYPLSQSAVATCITCLWVAIPVCWSSIEKPLSRGSIAVMKCFLSVQASGARRRRRVFLRERSAGRTLLRRFQESSQGASSGASS